MRIVIDMQACQSPFSASRGVGRYTDNLVRALLKDLRGHEIYLALNGSFGSSIEHLRADFEGLISQERIIVCQNYLPTQFALDGELARPKEEIIRISEIVWEAFLNSVQPDIIFSPNLQEGFSDSAITSVRRWDSNALYVTTLHDMTPYHFREKLLVDETVRDWYEEKIRYAVTSDIIVTVSEAAKNDIVNFTGVNKDHVKSIYSGFDDVLFTDHRHLNKELARQTLENYGIDREYIFYFGGNDICKNIPRLIESYALLDQDIREQYLLVLGGRSFKYDPYGQSHSETQKQIEALGLQDQIITPGFIQDTDLPTILASSSCFVFPSTHEGFGLPALEAMACGAPVIGSNRSSIIEVIGNEEALFDPYDVQDVANKMNAVLRDRGLQQSLRISGLKRARKFSWAKAASELLDVWEKATRERKAARTGYSGDMLLRVLNAVRPYVGALDGDELCSLSRMLDESFRPTGRPCIYLDASAVVRLDDRTGIQRVTRAVAAEMLSNPPTGYDVQLIYSSEDEEAFYVANHYKQSVLGIQSPGENEYVVFKPGDIMIFLDQAPRMAINHKSFIRYLRSIGVRVYFYVHDLIPLRYPQWFSEGGVEEFAELMETVATADGALCNSRVSAQDVKAYVEERLECDRRPFRIAYAHLGTDFENSAPSTGMPVDAPSVLAQFEERPTFLMIGTIEPRKGHRQTLRAFERLWSEGRDLNLVIVGRWGWKMEGFDAELRSHAEFGKRLFWLRSISDEYLLKVYEQSDCLIAASQAEGFGLPLIEAAQHGIPVIARDIPIFREVAGNNALYFPDHPEPETIENAVSRWLEMDRSGTATPSIGMKMLSWKQSVEEMLNALLTDSWAYAITALNRPEKI